MTDQEKDSVASKPAVESPWAREFEDVAGELSVSVEDGLSASDAKKRLSKYGRNQLREAKSRSAWSILIAQFMSMIVGLLVVAAVVSALFEEWLECFAIVLVLAINTGIGFYSELKAIRSMEALRKLGRVSATVLREGNPREVPAKQLVPGDVVLLEPGDIVAADLRLFEAAKLQCDESALTGESVPVSKSTAPVGEESPVAERSCMAFKGTAATRGSGKGIVVATGMATELGAISALVEEAEGEVTPLEKRLDVLGRKLVWLTVGVSVIVAIAGYYRGKDLMLMVETGVALAVACIPEGLPIVATIALARGMWRMARHNALMTRLSSVETLGSVNVICTDKTGTLTENKMTASRYVLAGANYDVSGKGLETEGDFTRDGETVDPQEDKLLREALEVGALCSNASLQGRDGEESEAESEATGDPMEIALLVAAAKAGLRRESLLEEWPEEREEAFDSSTKMMATYHRRDEAFYVAVKGAAEAVLDVSTRIANQEGDRELDDEQRERWIEKNEALAGEGLRVLALASKSVDSTDAEPYEKLRFLGLVALYDPPREEIPGTLESCRRAGIRVIMVTGDHAVTARSIAQQTKLVEEGEDFEVAEGKELPAEEEEVHRQEERILRTPVFARVSPAQKLSLIEAHQDSGNIVAMTGDGVNDAPALKKADIGIAMGQRGTQVAREAADMVLQDDAFGTIVTAIEQGRIIFGNIRKFVIYLMAVSTSEVLVVFLASLANMPLPLKPLMILYLNVITDVFPALALGVGEGDPEIMRHPPRDPSEPIMAWRHWLAVGAYGLFITIGSLLGFYLAGAWLGLADAERVTVAYLSLAFGQVWHTFNLRDHDQGIFDNEVTRNRWVWGAIALCIVLLTASVYIAPLAAALGAAPIGLEAWGLVLLMSLIPLISGQLYLELTKTT